MKSDFPTDPKDTYLKEHYFGFIRPTVKTPHVPDEIDFISNLTEDQHYMTILRLVRDYLVRCDMSEDILKNKINKSIHAIYEYDPVLNPEAYQDQEGKSDVSQN